MSTKKRWSFNESLAEGTQLSCVLSKNSYLLNFMQNIFIKLTRLMYGSFCVFPNKDITHYKEVHENALKDILNKFKPMYDREYLLRPGLDNMSDEVLLAILNNIIEEGCDERLNKFSLNQLMGAVYGVSTDRTIIGKILIASMFKEFRAAFDSTNKNVHARSIKDVVELLRSIFGIPITFSKESVIRTLGYPSADNQLITLLLDMMVYKFHGKNISIVRRNLNNLPYIRVRSDKQQTEYKEATNLPFCPTFHKKNMKNPLKIVHGNSWYYVPNESIMRKFMKMFGRKVKAGISGSTLMWMNLCFHVIGIEETRENLELLLFCIISDFVPKYHSLAEILLVYSNESPYTENHPYLINEPSIRWLIYELERGRSIKIDKTKLVPSINEFIMKVYDKSNENILKVKCEHKNIKIDSHFRPITQKMWKRYDNSLQKELSQSENLKSPFN